MNGSRYVEAAVEYGEVKRLRAMENFIKIGEGNLPCIILTFCYLFSSYQNLPELGS